MSESIKTALFFVFQFIIMMSNFTNMKLYDEIEVITLDRKFLFEYFGDSLESISKNLRKAPIFDITTVDAKDDCPQGFEQIAVGSFRGTKSACFCPTPGVVFVDMKCSVNDLAQRCWNIPAISSQEFYTWKDTSICAKTNTRYYHHAGLCGDGFKNCADNLCIDVSQKCPITVITLSDDSGQDEFLQIFNASRKFNSSTFLVGFESTLTNKTCLDREYSPPRQHHGQYNLFVQKETGCPIVQNESVIIDSQTEWEYYKENDKREQITSLPSFFEHSHNEHVFLQADYRIKLNQSNYVLSSCRKLFTGEFDLSFNPKNFQSYLQNKDYFSQMILNVAFVAMIAILILFVPLVAIKILRGENTAFQYLLFGSFLIELLSIMLIICANCFAINFFEFTEKDVTRLLTEPMQYGLDLCFESQSVNEFLRFGAENALILVNLNSITLKINLVFNFLFAIVLGILCYSYIIVERFNPQSLGELIRALKRSFN